MAADDVMRKIKGLLAKTVENGATETESAAAARLARMLLDKHNLSMRDVPSDDVREPDAGPIIERQPRPSSQKLFWRWQITVSQAVAQLYDCRIGYTRRGPIFIGTELDTEVAAEIYYWVIEQCETIYRFNSVNLATRFGHLSPMNRRTQFLEGLASALYNRTSEMSQAKARAADLVKAEKEETERAAEQGRPTGATIAPDRALVVITALVERKQQRVKDFMKQRGYKSRSSGRGSSWSQSARSAGASQAGKVRLHKEIG